MEFLMEYLNRLQCKPQTDPDLKTWGRAQNFQMTRRGFCIKVIWEPHMTSQNFGGDFKEVFERVVVQMEP